MAGDGEILKKTYKENDLIFEEGEPGDFAYLITGGEIGIYRDLKSDVPIRLASLSKGDIFGEMALFDDSPRVAGAKAHANAMCLALSKEAFNSRLEETDPVLRSIVTYMIQRLRQISDEVTSLRKKTAGIPD